MDYINILNEIIEEKIKQKNYSDCKKLIEEAKQYNYSEDKMSLIYRANALIFFEEGNYNESLYNAEKAMLYLDKINENKQKGEIIEKIFDTIILCYTKNYNNFIEKNNIKEAEIIFNEYISKLKDQKIKNKFIDKCSDILLKK